MALPAGLAHGAAGLLEDAEKIEGNERVVRRFAIAAGGAGKLIPFGFGESADAGRDTYRKLAAFGRLFTLSRSLAIACLIYAALQHKQRRADTIALQPIL